ncbi:MAG: hypothetical protein AAF694_22650 [Bacteroidota bacterium]
MIHKERLIKTISLAFGLLFLFNLQIVHGQDIFFLSNGGTESGIYEGVDGNKILFRPFNSQKSEKLKRKQVAMISNPQGWVRIFQSEREVLVNFHNDTYDLVLMASGEVLQSTEVLVHEKVVEFEKINTRTKEHIPVSSVAAVVYKTKQVLPLKDSKTVANLIAQMNTAGKFNLSDPKSVVKAQPATTLDAEGTVVFETQADIDQSADDEQEDEVATPRGVGEEVAEDGVPATLPPSNTIELTNKEGPVLPVSEDEFREKALRKTDQFSQYVKRVVDKNASRFEANKAINQAITLFVHDSSLVEVSNIKSGKNFSYFIREYLYHIQELKYDRVEIDWAEISYVGDIKLGPDGNWYGSVTFLQIFKGFRDGRLMYEDKTLKRMEVILKGYEKIREGKTEVLWDVLLSNIAVEHTS